ncbi:MAG: DNA topoisomerase III [Niameybacter sp.]|uniref:DNA topoisomerase III n=1 Tax=Niameybacter sp. TaxID=2033640 RepID=UPI002FC74937
MAKKLVLAEKPSVARDIARVLKCTKKGNGYLEGNDYIVTWALGHLVGLADPEAYDDRYKTWSMESLPMLPKQMKLVVLKGGGKQFSSVKEQMLRKDVTEIIIATDAGREGELVARWIIEKAKVNKPMKRLWISSVTDKAILEGFKSLKPAKDYENLFEAAVCRAEGDWLVGLNVTRALTCKYNAQLSAGRVQSATLAMIVTREEEIKNFKAEDYFNIKVKVPNFSLMWQGTKGPNIWNQDEAKKLQVQLEGKALQVVKVDESHKKAYAPGLYDLTELQRDANRLYGMSPKETLNVMQRLYENYKILTYPRTDSRYISQDIVSTLKDRLQAVNVGNFRPAVQAILKNGIKAGKHFVDNTKVSDHHAIIPTEESVMIAKLSNDERKIYELVVKRFLSVMLPPYEYKQTTIEAKSGEETFVAKGKVMINQGFKMVYDKGEEDSEETENGEVSLPEVKVGDSLKVVNVECNKLQTKPPARFTEATLLSAMESPHKYVKVSKEAAKTLGETGGIGTVATRADIIEKLYNMFYVEKNGNSVVPTSKGKQLIELVPEELKTPLLTAKWERELELISKGKQNPKDFIARMRKYSSELVDTVKGSTDQFKHDNVVGKRCPDCGKNLLEVKGKHGKMYVCQDRACGYRENVSKFTNARCPECHKRLELRGQGDGQIYVCTTCTFREKASTFNNRFKDKQGKGDKKSVQKYMKQQQKEDEGNFAFADLFANLNKK